MKFAERPSSQQPLPVTQAKGVFMGRLARLIELHRNFQEDLNPAGIKLLERSIFATYRDCADFGVEEQARALLARAGLNPEDVRRE